MWSLVLLQLPEIETLLYTSNLKSSKRLEFKATQVTHAAGDTTEYDLVLGQLPEDDGLTSEDEDAEMSGDDDGDEEEEEEIDMEDDE